MRHTRDADDDDEMVRDGERVRCPMYLMDAMQRRIAAFDANAHRPHHAELTDELRKFRAKTRTEYLAGLRDAWKSPAQRAMDSTTADADADPLRRRRAARDAMISHATNAWRSWPRDQKPDDDPDSDDPGAPASAVEQQLERWQGRDLSELARDVEARRRKSHDEFCNTLSNAWRSPGGTAAPEAHGRLWTPERSHGAGAIERQREQWTAER